MLYTKEKTKNISFPLGGIGTGSIGLGGNGMLIDWEIFNRPNKNTYNGYSHFAIKVKHAGKTYTRVLHGDTNESLMGMHNHGGGHIGFGFGPHDYSMAGFPHFRNVVFDGRFPMAGISFSDADFPAAVRLSAFNPFIPHNDFDSSLPAALFAWEIENPTDSEMECALEFTLKNPAASSYNEEISEDGCKGIFFKDAMTPENEIGYTDLAVMTDAEDSAMQAFWYRGAWSDSCTVFWKNLTELERMPARHYAEAGKSDHGTAVAYVHIAPHTSEKLRFVLAWNVPNAYNYWKPCKDENDKDVTWKNYYATQLESSKATALYALKKFDALYEKTRLFTEALHKSTLPAPMIDAITANLSVLKSPTVLRLTDGSLWGWEGCLETVGSCEGSCQHVWNYAYALPFLFPRLERSLRENTMKYALAESGETEFRIPLPPEREHKRFRACVDGQMGEVIKCYREWKISGDDAWLRAHADKIFSMLEYAWSKENPDKWDADKDGVLEGRQHHTLDMELFGPSSWLEGFYLLALSLGAEMAEAVGERERASEYRALYEKGRAFANEKLFNGEYFYQRVALGDKATVAAFGAEDEYWNAEAEQIKYQVAEGCIIDQMLADFHAAAIGVPGVFDEAKKQIALDSLYRYNFKPSMREVTNMWRNFALNDEAGTVICSYPETVQTPVIPIPYCEECMTGFEYALAALMLANGKHGEAEAMVRAIRDRYDGEKRNPWNEIECGSNYARSMASFALLPIASGFSFDMTKKHIGFAPRLSEEGKFFFSVENTWGTVEISRERHILTVHGAPLTLASYGVKGADRVKSVQADGREVAFSAEGERITFCAPVTFASLEVAFI